MVLPEAMLGCYDTDRPLSELTDKGFSPELLNEYDVGFDEKRSRITFPVRDIYGNLAGISGRATKPGQMPKYRNYDLSKWYPGYTYEKGRHLYNGDRVYSRLYWGRETEPQIPVVEGYKACLWMLQSGFENTVALMGSTISETQVAVFHRLGAHLLLFLDNGVAEIRKTQRIAKALRGPCRISVVTYPFEDRAQPDDFDSEELQLLIRAAIPLSRWLKEPYRHDYVP